MELEEGSIRGIESVQWVDEVESSRAFDKLAKVFYKFKEIDFLPFSDVQAAARARKKPIFAMVALGAVDDQNC